MSERSYSARPSLLPVVLVSPADSTSRSCRHHGLQCSVRCFRQALWENTLSRAVPRPGFGEAQWLTAFRQEPAGWELQNLAAAER